MIHEPPMCHPSPWATMGFRSVRIEPSVGYSWAKTVGYLWATHAVWAFHRPILGDHRKCMGYPWLAHGLPMRYPPHRSDITVNLHGLPMGDPRDIRGMLMGYPSAM